MKNNDKIQRTTNYIEMFYNSNRRHSYLGYVSPKKFEDQTWIPPLIITNLDQNDQAFDLSWASHA